MNIRHPSVAGSFYPGKPNALTDMLNNLYRAEEKKIDISLAGKNIIGGVVPHAGYVY